MKLSFRTGIVQAPIVSGNPNFLQFNSFASTINISLADVPILISASNKTAEYLYEHRVSKSSAWGPFNWNTSDWGPAPSLITYQLYWDFNLASGQISFGYSPFPLIVAESAPPLPSKSQTWFNSTTQEMTHWDGTFWRPCCRVFAGTYSPSGFVITHKSLGSQVGLTYPGTLSSPINAGFIVFGMDQRGVKAGDFFLTTATEVITNQGSYSSPVKLENLSTVAIASEPIPTYYCVTNLGNNIIGLASGSDASKRPIGIVEDYGVAGQSLRYVTSGLIFNDQWNWDIEAGKDLYCGPTGALIQDISQTQESTLVRVGTIISTTVILVQIDLLAVSPPPAIIEVIGPTGPSGPQGIAGPTGPQGVAGPTGSGGGGQSTQWAMWRSDATDQILTAPLALNTVAQEFSPFIISSTSGGSELDPFSWSTAGIPASLLMSDENQYARLRTTQKGIYKILFEAYKLDTVTGSFDTGMIIVRIVQADGDGDLIMPSWNDHMHYSGMKSFLSYYKSSDGGDDSAGYWSSAEISALLLPNTTYRIEWVMVKPIDSTDLTFRTKRLTCEFLGPADETPTASIDFIYEGSSGSVNVENASTVETTVRIGSFANFAPVGGTVVLIVDGGTPEIISDQNQITQVDDLEIGPHTFEIRIRNSSLVQVATSGVSTLDVVPALPIIESIISG